MPFETPQLKGAPFGWGGSLGPKPTPAAPQGKQPPPKAPRGVRIEDRIGINAPASVIWEVIYDLPRWSEWNPTYPQAAGDIRIGGTLTLTVALPGEAPQEIRPTVMDWVPNEQLLWRLTMLLGAVRTIRYIEINHLAEESCIVDNGEIFGGLMGPSLGRRVGRTVQRGFRAMNEAMKARAEAIWQGLKTEGAAER